MLRKLEHTELPRLLELKLEKPNPRHRPCIVNSADQEAWFHSLDYDPVSPRSLILGQYLPELVGIAKLEIDWVNRSADVGWDVFPEHRGRRHGRRLVLDLVEYASETLNLHRLTAEILAGNEASAKCAIGAGFAYEGAKRQAVWRGGRYIDSDIYGILLRG